MTRRLLATSTPLALVLALAAGAPAQAPARARLHVIENVRLALDGEPVLLVLDAGRIREVLPAGAGHPPGARVVDGAGGLAVPAFVDAYGRAGVETPTPVADRDLPVSTESDVRIDMRSANRRGVQPAFRVVDALVLEDKLAGSAREAGFATLCVAPSGHLLPGVSAVVTTRTAALRDVVLVPEASEHAELSPSDGGYPSTLMGCMAQLRQLFWDAGRHRQLLERAGDGRDGLAARPPHDADLEALLPVLDGERLVCHAESHRDIERWLRLADELGFELAITGGRDAWKLADELAAREVPVVLTLDWEKEVDDPDERPKKKPEEDRPEGEAQDEESEEPPPSEAGSEDEEASGEAEDEPAADDESRWEYVEPLEVRRERRRLWEEQRDGALRLHEAGVRIAFGSGGDSHADLLKQARALVEAGLPSEVALAALTGEAAAFLGLGEQLGGLEQGMVASVGVWTGDPLEKGSKLAWLFVEGFPYEFELDQAQDQGPPDEGVDGSGRWTIEQEERGGTTTWTVVLEMTESGEVTGTLTRPDPSGEGELEAELEGRVSGKTMTLSGSAQFGDMEVTYTLKGDLDGDTWSGTSTVKGPWGEMDRAFEALREPEQGGTSRGVR